MDLVQGKFEKKIGLAEAFCSTMSADEKPLMCAIKEGSAEAVRELLDNGADIEQGLHSADYQNVCMFFKENNIYARI